MRFTTPLILASGSPRRRQMLEQVGFSFSVVPSGIDEDAVQADSPGSLVETLARAKAKDVASTNGGALVIGADTVVVLGGKIVGKPKDQDEARAILRQHSGQTHTVYTGFCVVHGASNRMESGFEETRVTFGTMTESEIVAYVETGSPMDKAGAYGYQDSHGPLFVEKIEGDYYNVIGLPLRRVYLTLQSCFPDLLE